MTKSPILGPSKKLSPGKKQKWQFTTSPRISLSYEMPLTKINKTVTSQFTEIIKVIKTKENSRPELETRASPESDITVE